MINLLDDSRNDIFVHIDKKCKVPKLITKKSKLNILKKRVDVRWGSVSQIKTELLLFETAYNNPVTYSYYHLLSGVDLPIKSNDYIHAFFSKYSGLEFIGFCKADINSYLDRITKIHLLRNYNRINNRYINKIRFYLEIIVNKIYKLPYKNIEYKKGPNWVSITGDFVKYMLQRKYIILSEYKYSLCADEIYKQTLAWNSSFRNKLYISVDDNYSCKRLIDWERGNPYTFGIDEEIDFNIIKKSDALFARKFDFSKFPHIINKIQTLNKAKI